MEECFVVFQTKSEKGPCGVRQPKLDAAAFQLAGFTISQLLLLPNIWHGPIWDDSLRSYQQSFLEEASKANTPLG